MSGRQVRFDEVENHCGRSDAVYSKNLTSGFGALLQNAFEYLFLKVERAVVSRADHRVRLHRRIVSEGDNSPKGQFRYDVRRRAGGEKPETRANVTGEARDLEVAWPRFRRGSDCERVDTRSLPLHCIFKARIQVEVTMKIYEGGFMRNQLGVAWTAASNSSISSSPRR